MKINTPRLILRPLIMDDKVDFFNYRSDAITNKYQGWIPKEIADAEVFINKQPKEFNIAESWFQFAIIENSTSELVGDVGVHFYDEENFQVEIGCTLRKQSQGKGYAVESLENLISSLFSEFNKHRVTTSIDPDNISSIKLVEALGFRKEAYFKQSLLIDNKWVDDIVYAVLSSEWKKK